jgi:hypothetical protein
MIIAYLKPYLITIGVATVMPDTLFKTQLRPKIIPPSVGLRSDVA